MKTTLPQALALCLLCSWAALRETAARSPEKQTVAFSFTNDVGFGNEVFVSGNHPDLGGNDPALARKLHWTTGNVWTGQVALQSGTALQYRFIKRAGGAPVFCQSTNATNLSATLSLVTTNQPTAPYPGKTILYHSIWTNAFILYQSGTNWISAPMTNIGPGRAPGEYLYRVGGIGEAGEPIEFVPYNSANQYDNAPYPGYGANDYYTPLDVIFLQDKHIFNYRPPTNLSAPRIVVVTNLSTVAGIPGRNIRIYLPRGYDQNTWKRYPVLYFHDGQNVFDPGGPFGSWSADATATREMSQGRMRECILVGVDNNANRIQEYLPPTDSYSGNQGWGDRYANYLVNNVRPYVNAQYRTLTNRDNTLTVGSSMGGLISAWLGWDTNYTAYFSKLGVMSSAFWIAPNFVTQIDTATRRDLRIYFDWGSAESDADMWNPSWNVYNLWQADGYVMNRDFLTVIGCGQIHNEAAWASRLPGAFRFLLAPGDEANRLALELFPPRLRVTSVDTAAGRVGMEHASQKGAAYQLERTQTLPATNWLALTNFPTEPLAWGVRNVEATSANETVTSFWRLQLLPLP